VALQSASTDSWFESCDRLVFVHVQTALRNMERRPRVELVRTTRVISEMASEGKFSVDLCISGRSPNQSLSCLQRQRFQSNPDGGDVTGADAHTLPQRFLVGK